MIASIGTFQLADGTLSGGVDLTDFRLRVDRIFEAVIPVVSFQRSGALVIGSVYVITDYVGGDDFTNVGASSNANGVIFEATGQFPASWNNGTTLEIRPDPVFLDRDLRKFDLTFTIARVHASIDASEQYIQDHDATIPNSGAFVITTVSGLVWTLSNSALTSHNLTRESGATTFHAYHVVGGQPFEPAPVVGFMLLESGDYMLLETGDKMLLEG